MVIRLRSSIPGILAYSKSQSLIHVWYLLLMLLPFSLWAQNVSVSASIDPYKLYENQPLSGTLQVTHPSSVEVPLDGFTIEGQPLKVKFLSEIAIESGSSLRVSNYHFELPGKPKGLYVLPAIALKIGSESYQSIPSTYLVDGPAPQSAPQPAAPAAPPPSPTPAPAVPQPSPAPAPSPSAPPLSLPQPVQSGASDNLKLQVDVKGSTSLYPGQRLTLIYKYLYKGDIALTKEDLPLLNPPGFIKVGEKEITNGKEGDASIQEVSQNIQAVKPGDYTIGPSVLEGYLYGANEQGQNVVLQNLHAEAAPVHLIIKPFPSKGLPASFNGAIGQLSFNSELDSPSTLSVGDQVVLKLTIAGTTPDWSSIQPPDLCCQPGFSGLFKLSDIPPSVKIEKDSKTFRETLIPLASDIQAIPSIEFSYFDPQKESYVILHSNPIPITVQQGPVSQPQQAVPSPSKGQEKALTLSPPAAVEVVGNFEIDSADLHNKQFGTWNVFWVLPLGVILLAYQLYLKRSGVLAPRIPQKKSIDIFNEFMKAPLDSVDFYHLLNQAMVLALVEQGEISSDNVDLPALPKTGKSDIVRRFLQAIEEQRFAGKTLDGERIRREAQGLFNEVHKRED